MPTAKSVIDGQTDSALVEPKTTNTEERQQESMRERVRMECLVMLSSAAMTGKSAMADKDVNDYMKAMEEDAIKEAKDHKEKMKWLQEMKSHARTFVNQTLSFGEDYLMRVKLAKDGEQSEASKKRWQQRMKERKGNETWADARERLRREQAMELVELAKNWRQLKSNIKDLQSTAKRAKLDSSKVPELNVFDSEAFKNAKYPEQLAMFEKAKNAVFAELEPRERCHLKAKFLLKGAAAEGLLDPRKIDDALRGIHEEPNLERLKTYVDVTLESYYRDWVLETNKLMELDALTKERGLLISVLPRKAFIGLGYAERNAYLSATEARIQALKGEQDGKTKALEGIHREVDQESDVVARKLLEDALARFGDDPRFATLERLLDAREEGVLQMEDRRDPKDVLRSMRDTVSKLPMAVQGLTRMALEADGLEPESNGAHLRCVSAMLDTTTQLRQRGVLTDTQAKETEEEQPKVEVQRVTRTEEVTEDPSTSASSTSEDYAEARDFAEAGDDPTTLSELRGAREDKEDDVALSFEQPIIPPAPIEAQVFDTEPDEESQRKTFAIIQGKKDDPASGLNAAIRPPIDAVQHADVIRAQRSLKKDALLLEKYGMRFTLGGEISESTQKEAKKAA